jgi:hypothetical protein
LSYQWSQDGAPIAGATAAIYDIPAGQDPGLAGYTVSIDCPTNPACADSSDPTLVEVVPEPAGVGPTLTVARSETELLLEWDAAAGADDYVVFSSLAPDGPFDDVTGSAGGTALALPLPGETAVFYLVAGRNPVCGVGARNELRTE